MITLLSGIPYYEGMCRGLGETVEGYGSSGVEDTGCQSRPSLLPHFTWEETQAGQRQTRSPIFSS